MPQLFKPVSLTIAGILAFLIWAWFEMCGISYRPRSHFFGLQTAGWFIIGLPILLGIALGAVIPVTLLARKTHQMVGWLAILAFYGVAIFYAFRGAMPMSRLDAVLNVEIPDNTTIAELHERDTFNDGSHLWGSFSGSPELIEAIAVQNDLSLGETSLNILKAYFDDAHLPEYADAYSNERLTCYYEPDSKTIYFDWRSR